MKMFESALSILTFYMTWPLADCEFFHVPSAVQLNSGSSLAGASDFGFSLGYFNKSLVVGDPQSSQWGFGEMYRCSLNIPNDTHCSNIQIEKDMKNYTTVLNEHQNFYLGATIATSDDYIFTCAPLATIFEGKRNLVDAFGSCFISNDGSFASYMDNGPVERYELHPGKNKDKITGGVGWNSLADQVNGYFLVAKTSIDGDINYWDLKHPMETESQSALDNVKTKKKFNEAWNIGYGLAAGNFFSNKTVYAVSMQTKRDIKGQIVFLEPVDDKLLLMNSNKRMICQISNLIVNAMFGYALASADINLDGYSELLIGAPTQSNGDVESGAIYIYLGADITKITCYDRKRMRSILADKPFGRFGTSIAAADIDGDSVAEVFVSAPYEDSGVVYVLSGFELRSTVVRLGRLQPVFLSELKLTQRIHREGFRLFGFSLLVIPDVDGNGCSDLAVGAPASSSVVLLRSYQTINVTISLEIVGSQLVKEEDKSFIVGVCLNFGYIPKSSEVSGHLYITNSIDDPGVHIPEPEFDFLLSKKITEYCKNVTVNLKKYGSGDYKFVTNLHLKKIDETKEFNTTWAVLSPYSDTKKSLDIPRHCKDEDCNPKLSMRLFSSIKDKEYNLGTTKTESVTVEVQNSGHVAYSACVRLQIQGALVQRLDCDRVENEGQYRCMLSEPLRHSANRSIIIQLDMQKSRSNMDKELIVDAKLYVNCDQKNFTQDRLMIPYNVWLEKKNIRLDVKDPHKFFVTDSQLLSDENDDLKLNQEPLRDVHEFLIKNNGMITWNNIPANIFIDNSSFIEKVNTTEPNCISAKDDGTRFKISCILQKLQPSSAKEISVSIHFLREKLGKINFANVKTNVTSEMILSLIPTNETKTARFVSDIELTVDRSFRNNKKLIYILAIIGALIILILITIALIKYGFFKRKQKQRLDSLRDSIRKRSFRRESERRQSQKASMAGGSGLPEVEEVEDCVFGEVSLTPPIQDDVRLVEAEAQVHTEKCI